MKIAFVLFFSVLVLLLFHACENDHIPHISPVVTIEALPMNRQVVDTDLEFIISIPEAIKSEASVDYATTDGTALGGVDFIATSGTATIPAGELSTRVHVTVKADSLRKDFQYFFLELTNPMRCTLSETNVKGVIENKDGLYLPVDNTGYTTPDSYPDYTLVWSDEFNGHALNENNWSYEIGNNGWGTQELEFYTDRTQNAFVSCGNLILEARKEYKSGSAFTSSRLTTKDKKSFKYGRIDIRAKVPCSQGIMASLWMLGSNVDAVGWPTCGEIDIMQLPHTENYVYNTLHWGSSATPHQFGFNQPLGAPDNKFHVFSAVWDADQITMYIDDVSTFNMSTSDSALPFNNPFFFIFNVAVGGQWPGSPDNTTSFPQRMVVDYVRVFQ